LAIADRIDDCLLPNCDSIGDWRLPNGWRVTIGDCRIAELPNCRLRLPIGGIADWGIADCRLPMAFRSARNDPQSPILNRQQSTIPTHQSNRQSSIANNRQSVLVNRIANCQSTIGSAIGNRQSPFGNRSRPPHP
jgi:hypothetical protein